MFKSIGLIMFAMMAMLFVACGGNDDGEQIKALQTQVAVLQDELNEQGSSNANLANDLRSEIDEVRDAQSEISGRLNREVYAAQNVLDSAFWAKVQLAAAALQEGQTATARQYMIDAYTGLGVAYRSCGVVLTFRPEPELNQLVDDIFTFIHYSPEGGIEVRLTNGTGCPR